MPPPCIICTGCLSLSPVKSNLEEQLNVIFFLTKFINGEQKNGKSTRDFINIRNVVETCGSVTQRPGDWFGFCSDCVRYITEARCIHNQIAALEAKLSGLRVKVEDKIYHTFETFDPRGHNVGKKKSVYEAVREAIYMRKSKTDKSDLFCGEEPILVPETPKTEPPDSEYEEDLPDETSNSITTFGNPCDEDVDQLESSDSGAVNTDTFNGEALEIDEFDQNGEEFSMSPEPSSSAAPAGPAGSSTSRPSGSKTFIRDKVIGAGTPKNDNVFKLPFNKIQTGSSSGIQPTSQNQSFIFLPRQENTVSHTATTSASGSSPSQDEDEETLPFIVNVKSMASTSAANTTDDDSSAEMEEFDRSDSPVYESIKSREKREKEEREKFFAETNTTPPKRKSKNEIKRPLNAFMVWSKVHRRKIMDLTVGEVNHSIISKKLGATWKALSNEEKLPYFVEANRLSDLHQLQYPGYKYRPQRKLKERDMPYPNSRLSISARELKLSRLLEPVPVKKSAASTVTSLSSLRARVGENQSPSVETTHATNSLVQLRLPTSSNPSSSTFTSVGPASVSVTAGGNKSWSQCYDDDDEDEEYLDHMDSVTNFSEDGPHFVNAEDYS